MSTPPSNLDALISKAECLGVIGSPSSTTELALDVLGTAVSRKLVGEMALFRFVQDSVPHYALGQITEIQLRNTWHEDPTMRSLIRQRGRVDAVSERQDTHLGKMTVSAVFKAAAKGGYEPSILGTVPSTGTTIHVIDDEMLGILLAPYRNQLFFLGHLYGSTPKLPMWFKHFDSGQDGAGEAYHLGVFGKTGAGKSELARMVLLAYARQIQMGMLVLDPQGEFSKGMKQGGSAGAFALPIGDIMRTMGRRVHIATVRNLVLDRWELFEQILVESPFFARLSMPEGSNRETAAEVLVEKLRKAKREGNLAAPLKRLHERSSFDLAWSFLKEESVQTLFYRTKDARGRFNDQIVAADPDHFFKDYWSPVAELFREDRPDAVTVDQALHRLLNPGNGGRPVLVVNLSREQAAGLFWNERIQALVIKRLFDGLAFNAEQSFRDERSLNTLVVIDEAHRLAPSHISEDDDVSKSVRSVLIDAVRTTRKYGLGWMFISQTLSSIHPEILQQLRIMFFGFGLSLGQEFQALRQLVGSSSAALGLYQLFRDPHSSFDPTNRQYSWMTIGPVSPLSFAGTPLFLNAFNRREEFLLANGLAPSAPPSKAV